MSHLRAFALKPLIQARANPRRPGSAGVYALGYVAGTVKIEGIAARRRVRCIERQTGCLVGETWSTADGSYRFDYLNARRRYQILAMDYELQFNAVIADNVGAVAGAPERPTPEPEDLIAPRNVTVADVAGTVTLSMSHVNLTQQGVRVYRSTSPIDPNSLPAPLMGVSGWPEVIEDTTAPAGTVLYYRLGAYRDDTEVISEEVEFDPDAAGAPIGVALVDDTVQGGVFEWIDASGTVIPKPAQAFFDNHPAFNLTEETVDGQHLINVPKSYWRRAEISIPPYSGTKDCWWVAAAPQPDYQLFSAFDSGGIELSHFQIGKYEGYVTGGKLCSLPAVTPTSSRSWNQFHIDADARNVSGVTGFCMHHMDMRSVIQWLYLIEVGSFDSQEATARGNVDSGTVYVTDHADNLAASYRGIVGLWGNLTEWIDGLRHVSGDIQRRGYGQGSWNSTGETRDTTATTYANSIRPARSVADLFIADTYQTSETGALVPDYQRWHSSGEIVALVGGNRSSGGSAGLWYLNVLNSATDAYSSVGSRLARVP
ncbi:hypothetical protein [Halomonas sp. SL1]|uniref:hypothetical protein n=1 Tax=Halomonas sp. SL1 TaxID=2137478 RepID=UPI000D167401|nr:hypothetical protein [Halomonas sp. SL1]RAH37406.1 hypothetical protein C9J49_010920 [Halomonas sp. SL1]